MKREGLFYAKEKGNYFHCQSILDFCINNAVPHHCHPLELLPSSVILLLTSTCAGVWANLNLEFVAVSWSWQSQGSWLFKGSLSSKEQDLTERFGWNSIGVALSLSLCLSLSLSPTLSHSASLRTQVQIIKIIQGRCESNVWFRRLNWDYSPYILIPGQRHFSFSPFNFLTNLPWQRPLLYFTMYDAQPHFWPKHSGKKYLILIF